MAAILIIGASLWYTNILVHKISQEERRKVKLWANAIQKKAKLVKYTHELFDKLKAEERKKVELWAEGTKRLANPSLNVEDVSFIFEVIKNNETVPVILTDEEGKIISSRNLDSLKEHDREYLRNEMEFMRSQQEPIEIKISKERVNYLYYKDSNLFSELKTVLDDLIKSFISEVAVNSASVPVIFTDSTRSTILASGNIDSLKISDTSFVQETIAAMEANNPPIEIEIGDGGKSYIFYQDSFILTQLKYYPYVQFGVIGLFLIIAYSLFSIARKAEQNQVWVGMAKEMAHQLGTPISSLMAWLEYLKLKGIDGETTEEIDKDVKRLKTISDRFSKIGSVPKLEKEDVLKILEESVNYIKSRTSKNVIFNLHSLSGSKVFAQLNVPLFEWVIENLSKNAIDAMEGVGSISIEVSDETQFVYIDITDSGKGIPKAKYKTIFQPGYTTKERGWGLGLSLSKRIIENYHLGKIFVKRSEVDKGTTFRIVLNK